MKKAGLFVCSLAFILTAGAQVNEKPTFQTLVQAGVMEGEAGTSFQLQAINGFRKKGYYLGLGVGLDYYRLRTVPAFFHLQKDFASHSKTPFVYLQGGMHFPWDKRADESWQQVKTRGGAFYEGGIGYAVPLKTLSLLLSAGYSYKRFSEEVTFFTSCSGINCPDLKNEYTYSLRRISIRAGIRF